MPYYAWRGVNLKAEIEKGTQFAGSIDELDGILLKRNVALLSYKQKKIWSIKPLSLQTKIDYFSHINELLKAGIRLPEVLQMVAQQTLQPRLAQKASDISQSVQRGITFYDALGNTAFFNDISKRLIRVGEESGNLTYCLDILVGHLQAQAQFQSQLRSALMVPLLTVGFFIGVVIMFFVVIVPQFMLIFNSLHKSLPPSTLFMLRVSEIVSSSWFLVAGAIAVVMVSLLLCTKRGMNGIKIFFLKMPLIGTILRYKEIASFLHAVSFLLKGGLSLTQAWHIARESVTQPWLAAQVYEMEHEIQAGRSLYEVMNNGDHQLWLPDALIFMKVGHEAGTLPLMLEKAATLYQSRVQRSLAFVTTVIQPLLLLILGLLITVLIIALYSPIMSLSSAI